MGSNVSWSRFTVWEKCRLQYKLKYIDKVRKQVTGIHAIFGTAMHETIQQYLTQFYNVSKKSANEMDLHSILMDRMKNEFRKARKDNGDEPTCTKEELVDFYWDGVVILNWFKKPDKQKKFFTKSAHELVGIEVPILMTINGVTIRGFIDVILKDKATGKHVLIDLKTSTSGWNKWKKMDDLVRWQLIMYKKWYSEQYNIPIEKIDVEYHILKRKIPDPEEVEYPVPRISKFVPPSGTVTVGRAATAFQNFINDLFDETGKIDETVSFPASSGNHCKWCDFYQKECPITLE